MSNLLLLITGSCVLVFTSMHLNKMFDISKRHALPKFTNSLMLFLFGLVGFLFSIHSEIISEYDESNSSSEGVYNWFNPADIFKFPLDQYSINRNLKIDKDNASLNKISLGMALEKDKQQKHNYTIVIDKSPSTKRIPTTDIADFYGNIKASIKSSLSQYSDLKLDSINLEDLILFDAILHIAKSNPLGTKFEIMYYFGNKEYLSPQGMPGIPAIVDSANVKGFVGSLAQYVKEKVNEKAEEMQPKGINVNTDIDFIINLLNNGDWLEDSEKNYNNIYFISDFEHEEKSGSSFEKLDQSLESLVKNKEIEQVNLIKITGKRNNRDSVSNTINLFRKNFNNLYYYEFNDKFRHTNDGRSCERQIEDIFSSVISDTVQNPSQPVILYNLGDDYPDNYCGSLSISSSSKGTIYNFGIGNSEDMIALADQNEKINGGGRGSYMLTMDNTTKVYPMQEAQQIDFSLTKSPAPIIFSTLKPLSGGYYIEINQEGTTYKFREPITLRRVLPVTSSLYLILVYSIFGLASLFGLMYFSHILFFFRDSKLSKAELSTFKGIPQIFSKYPSLILLLPAALLIFTIFIKIYTFIFCIWGLNNYRDPIISIIIINAAFIWLLILLYRFSLQQQNNPKKENSEPTKVNYKTKAILLVLRDRIRYMRRG